MILALWLLFRLSCFLFPLPLLTLERDYSTVSFASDGQLARILLSPRGTYRIRLPLDQMSTYIQEGFVRVEDRHFYQHPGVNPYAILRSAVENVRHRRVVMGGSTITMQIARLMEPKRRTYKAKLIEVFRALQLEDRYSKKELLDIYLNLVPMGGNIEGVGAASFLYFGKPAGQLSAKEAAILISVPRSPNHAHPGLPKRRFPNPFLYPHLVMRTRSSGDPYRKHLTVDPRIQALAEDHLKEGVRQLESEGAFNGAVIIIENKTMRVLAYVGSPDFNDKAHSGQVNGASIRRSPGSLLKPFLYGVAAERGLVTPRKLLFDIERNYDGYIPANFDRRFLGPVAAEEALARSLNVPAVNLEFELGTEGLWSFLRHATLIDKDRAERAPGLSLVLGAYPLTLEELVRLYAALSNQGHFRDLVFFEEDGKRPNAGVPILSPEACYLVTEMLSKLERPDLPQAWEFTSNRGRIAFKTGTSFGLKDAWSIGVNPHYTIGVWLGNVDAKSSSGLIGIKAAAPVVVSLFNDLTRYNDSWFRRPPGVKIREVCALSGEPAGPHCTARMRDLYIPGRSLEASCPVHQAILVRKKDGVEVCSVCMTGPRSAYGPRAVEIWPPDVATYLRLHGNERVLLPPHNSDCRAARDKDGLRVRSPMKGGFYAMTGALAQEAQKIPLSAQSLRAAAGVFWYVDDMFVAKGAPDDVFYVAPAPGRHHATVFDTLGHHDTVEFNVHRSF